MKRIAIVSLLMMAGAAGAGTMYRWVDSDGKVHYSDQPPPASANPQQVEQKRMGTSEADAGRFPYATQLAAKNFPVTLYVTDCGEACTRGRELLRKRGIPFTEKNPQQPAEQQELSKLLSGQLEVPVLKVGSNLVRGFEEGQWNSALDIAGYPQSAGAPLPPSKPIPKTGTAKPDTTRGEPPSGQPPQEEAPTSSGPYPVDR
jgi:uncharacterized protein DUF4124